MEHLDEGVAHAWIDGELSASDTLAVETHLQSCASCAAIVAEARGLVAATSRIVAQLDHVAAGVIPAAATTRPSALRARRVWWQHPAFAVAAVLGVTTLSWLSLRGTTGGSVATVASEHAPAVDVPFTAPTPTPTPSASAPRAREARARSTDASAGAAIRPDAQRLAVRAEAEPSRTIAPAPRAPMPSTPMPSAPMQSAPRQLEDRITSATNRAGAPGLTAEKASFAASASLAGCYVLARADNTTRSATMQLPPGIRLTDSVRVTNGAPATFIAYGLRDGTTAKIPLQYRRVGSSAFELSPASGDAVFGDATLGEAAFVRVLVVPADGARLNAPLTDAEFVARRQACP